MEIPVATGVLLTRHGGMPQLLPQEKFRDYEVPKLEPVDHYQQWTKALAGEGRTTSHFGYAGPLTETVLLGTIAARFPDDTLQWNSKALKFTNARKANAFLHAEYRKGWQVPGLS